MQDSAILRPAIQQQLARCGPRDDFPHSEFDLLGLAICTSNLVGHFDSHFLEAQRNGLELKTSAEALAIIEKKYNLVFATWSKFDLKANLSSKGYKL